VSLQSLTTFGRGYSVSITGAANTITDAVTFLNTGALTSGPAGGTRTLTGVLVATPPRGVTLAGTIATTDNAMTLRSPRRSRMRRPGN